MPLKPLTRWLKALGPSKTRLPAGAIAPLLSSSTESKAELLNGLNLANEGIVLLDATGRVVIANAAAHELAHSALASLAGADFWEALPEHIAESHRGAAEQDLQSEGAHQFVGHYEVENQWVEFTMRRQPDGMVVNLRNVSEHHSNLRILEESEFANQVLFDAHPQALWLIDVTRRRLVEANQAAAVFYGLPQDTMAGLAVDALFPPGESEQLLRSLPPPEFQGVMRVCTQKKADGERLLVELDCSSVSWRGHTAILVGVVDVGARHLAEGQLQRLNEDLYERIKHCTSELQRSHEELDAFSDAMAHDLKAPLHVVNGFAATLAERHAASLDEQGLRYLERIQASTRHMSKLIDDLRTLLQMSRMALTPEPVDLGPVARHLVDELCRRTPTRQFALEMEPELLLTGDRIMLTTALACLIENAWKFTSKKAQGWVKVGVAAGEEPDEKVLFVSDNGAGFDPAYAGKLFTAFQRLHSSADFPGSGLGLAIVKRVALRHGGRAWGETAYNAGATFFMSLPPFPPEPLSALPQAQTELEPDPDA